MTETAISLLERLARQPDSESWGRLVDVYTPLLKQWLSRYEVQDADADDLVQDVLMVVSWELPQFQHSRRQGAFRSWLRTILVHRLRRFWNERQRRRVAAGNSDVLQELEQLADAASGISRIWDREHDQHVVRRFLDLMEPKFSPVTWQAFWRVVMDGAKPDAVAAELNISVNSVQLAKSRVLNTLRREAQGLID